jgi:hypothetical protein
MQERFFFELGEKIQCSYPGSTVIGVKSMPSPCLFQRNLLFITRNIKTELIVSEFQWQTTISIVARYPGRTIEERGKKFIPMVCSREDSSATLGKEERSL